MTPQRPYLLRALYEWIVQNESTPLIVVDASVSGVIVPSSALRDDKVVLNLSSNATKDLQMGDEYVMFAARFDGISEEICLPIESITAILAGESNEGMVFPDEEFGADKPRRGPSTSSEESSVTASIAGIGADVGSKVERSNVATMSSRGSSPPEVGTSAASDGESSAIVSDFSAARARRSGDSPSLSVVTPSRSEDSEKPEDEPQ